MSAGRSSNVCGRYGEGLKGFTKGLPAIVYKKAEKVMAYILFWFKESFLEVQIYKAQLFP